MPSVMISPNHAVCIGMQAVLTQVDSVGSCDSGAPHAHKQNSCPKHTCYYQYCGAGALLLTSNTGASQVVSLSQADQSQPEAALPAHANSASPRQDESVLTTLQPGSAMHTPMAASVSDAPISSSLGPLHDAVAVEDPHGTYSLVSSVALP